MLTTIIHFGNHLTKNPGAYFTPFSQNLTDLKGKFCFPVLHCVVPALLHKESYLSLTLNDLLKARKAVSVRVEEFCLLIQSSNDKTIYLIKWNLNLWYCIPYSTFKMHLLPHPRSFNSSKITFKNKLFIERLRAFYWLCSYGQFHCIFVAVSSHR